MQHYTLDKEEKELMREIEKGGFRRIRNFKKQAKLYQEYARATLDKKRNINIRVAERDLLKLKARAVEKGLPYQTLVTSVLHQYSTGVLRERDEGARVSLSNHQTMLPKPLQSHHVKMLPK